MIVEESSDDEGMTLLQEAIADVEPNMFVSGWSVKIVDKICQQTDFFFFSPLLMFAQGGSRK